MKICFDYNSENPVGMNDYTSYESHFTKELFEVCEFKLYERKLRKNFSVLLDHIKTTYAGRNILKNKCFTGEVDARRMSGEMNTSLGNGFTNLMITWFMLWKSGISKEELVSQLYCVVEGDDSLFANNDKVDFTIYSDLGITAKPEFHRRIGDASFCGMVFDEEDRVIICDVRKHLVGLGWGDSKYAFSRDIKKQKLIRAKAMSLLWQYPGCPILDAVCRRILYLTRSLDVRNVRLDDTYKTEVFQRALKNSRELIASAPRPIPMRTRILMEEKFGISVNMQMYIEKECASFTLGFNDKIALVATDEQIAYARRCVHRLDCSLMRAGLPIASNLVTHEQALSLVNTMSAGDYDVFCRSVGLR